jgi:hypothetical protein
MVAKYCVADQISYIYYHLYSSHSDIPMEHTRAAVPIGMRLRSSGSGQAGPGRAAAGGSAARGPALLLTAQAADAS